MHLFMCQMLGSIFTRYEKAESYVDLSTVPTGQDDVFWSYTKLTIAPALVPLCCYLISLVPVLNVDPVPILLFSCLYPLGIVHPNILFLDLTSLSLVNELMTYKIFINTYALDSIYIFHLKNETPPLLLFSIPETTFCCLYSWHNCTNPLKPVNCYISEFSYTNLLST